MRSKNLPEQRDDVGIVLYNVTEDFLSVLQADGNEISTVLL